MLDRSEQIARRAKCIINDQRQVIFFRKIREFFKIRNIQTGIADRFQVNGLGIFIDVFYKAFHIVAIGKTCFDTQPFKGHFKLVVSAAVEKVVVTKLSPACRILFSARNCAACPEPVANAATPPSRAAMRCSNTSVVGFMIRV